jgi:hypothetical protein
MGNSEECEPATSLAFHVTGGHEKPKGGTNMSDLRSRVESLCAELTRQFMQHRRPDLPLGTAQKELVDKLVERYLTEYDDSLLKGVQGKIVTVGDALVVLEQIRDRLGERTTEYAPPEGSQDLL